MNRIIPLWPDEAPYTEFSPDRFQPFMKEFRIEGSRGAVIVCPGGAYTQKCDYEGDPVCEMLNEAGISAYTLDYRIVPCHHEAPLADALRAVRILHSMGYEKVGIMGFSAGGHLSCCAATLYDGCSPDSEDPIERFSSRPDAFIPCYGVTDLLFHPALGSRINLLGKYAEDEAMLHRFSPVRNVTADTPPAFIWHTAADGLVPVLCSLALGQALSAHNVRYEMHIFPNGPHGMALAKNDPIVGSWTAMCQKWLIGQGFGA